MEEQLRTLWSQVLNIDGSDIRDQTNFFQAGGDSVSSITLSGRANDAGLELFPQTIYENPVFSEMAKRTGPKTGGQGEKSDLEDAVGSKNVMESWDLIKTCLLQCNITHQELEDIYPCAPFQEELMRSSNDSGLWSYQVLFKIDGEVSLPQAKQAFELNWQRNPIFRSRIVQFGPTAYQVIVNSRPKWKEYKGELSKFQEIELSERFRYGEPTCRLAVVRDAGILYIVWTKTHAIHDYWSTIEFIPDLRAAFTDPGAFAATKLRPPHRSFVEFIAKHRRSGMKYWKDQLAGLRQWDHLWRDDTRKPWTYATANDKRYLKTVEYKRIKSRHAGLDALGQAAWVLTFANETEQDSVFFMQTRTCRRMPLGGIDQIIGPCWSPCPVRRTLAAKDTLEDLMMDISAKTNEATTYEPFGLPAALEHFGHRRFLQFVLTVQPPEQEGFKENITAQEKDGCQISMQPETSMQGIRGHYGFSNTLTPTADGKVVISVRYDDTFIDGDRVGEIVGKFEKMFAVLLNREWKAVQLHELCPHLLPDRMSPYVLTDDDTTTTLSAIVREGSKASAMVVPGNNPLEFSHGDLHKLIDQMQRRLAKLGIGGGSNACLALPNSMELIVVFLALTWQRGIATPLNPAYKQGEFEFSIGDLGSDVVIIPQGTYENQGPAVRAARRYEAAIAECYWDGKTVAFDIKEEGKMATAEKQEMLQAEAEDVALIIHTSGTTGRPKAVPLTHANLVESAQNISHTYELTPKDRGMVVLPLFNVHGLLATLSPLYSGGSTIVSERLTPEFWKIVDQHRATWYTATPSMHRVTLQFPPPSASALERIRFIRSSSARLSSTLFKQLEDAYNVPVLEAWGMTESSSLATSNPLPPLKRKPDSVGKPQGVALQILDNEGKPVPPGEVGEVSIRGPTITKGYLNAPDVNKSAFTADGFLRSGDLGKLDQDGYLTLIGRLKEMINKGGEKISPFELDDLINHHESVSEAVAFAIEDEAYGQNVACAVKLAEGKQLSELELRKWVAERLSASKAPSKVWFLDEIPKTATGKVQRRLVAEATAKQ